MIMTTKLSWCYLQSVFVRHNAELFYADSYVILASCNNEAYVSRQSKSTAEMIECCLNYVTVRCKSTALLMCYSADW